MNYPVWDVPVLGAGLVVAIIAVFHVLVSHFAIGGGAFLFGAEWWASQLSRSGRAADGERVRDFLHRYATFFLVFTTVFGAMTGVGIWFAIGLASPEGTSLLIHQFVFAWATEWVMFLAELSLLYLYYYGWNRNPQKDQRFLAGAYFVVSWFSLFIINGILSFMLTPGGWTLENRDLAAGFFNPSFWPSLVLRTVTMFLIGGLGGILVAGRLAPDDPLKPRIIGFSARFVVPAALLAPFLFAWYWSTLPEGTVKMVQDGVAGLGGGRLTAITRHLILAGAAGFAVMAGVLLAVFRPRAVTTGAGVALLLIVQMGLMGAEFFREMARKPYVLHGTLYSNSLWRRDVEAGAPVMQAPFLGRARWHPEVQPLSPEHGAWVFRLQCASCHTREGYRSILSRTASWTPEFAFRWFQTMHEQGVMPPFQGSEEDRAALAAYLLDLHGKALDGQDVLRAARKPDAPQAAPAPAPAAAPAPQEAPQ